MANQYRGFSTIDRSKRFRLTDVELVKRDLINHFSIRKGEKLMQPDFGSIIWSMLFEPMNDATHQAIVDDVERIVSYDPRINLQAINIDEQDHGLQISLDLLYVPTNQATELSMNFDSNSDTLTTRSSR